MKIAIISSANDNIPESIIPTVDSLVNSVKKISTVKILTGGSAGIPGYIIKKAKMVGVETTAYSPDENKDSHNKRIDNLATYHFDEVKYHDGFTVRSLAMINEADCVLVLNGRMGTLSEFTIALEEGKRIRVITNTGGIADHLKKITILANKDFPNQVFFSRNPAKVINWLAKK